MEEKKYGVCPECGAPCEVIEGSYKEELHDVHYVEHKYSPAGAVWVKGEYDRLYEQVKGGKRTVCYVDYNWSVSTLVEPVRDICTIKPGQMELSSRGHCYGSSRDWVALEGLSEKEAFIKMCEDSKVEWLCEGTAAGREGDLRAEIDRRNKLLEDGLKLQCRLNMPGISEQEQERAWATFKLKNSL